MSLNNNMPKMPPKMPPKATANSVVETAPKMPPKMPPKVESKPVAAPMPKMPPKMPPRKVEQQELVEEQVAQCQNLDNNEVQIEENNKQAKTKKDKKAKSKKKDVAEKKSFKLKEHKKLLITLVCFVFAVVCAASIYLYIVLNKDLSTPTLKLISNQEFVVLQTESNLDAYGYEFKIVHIASGDVNIVAQKGNSLNTKNIVKQVGDYNFSVRLLSKKGNNNSKYSKIVSYTKNVSLQTVDLSFKKDQTIVFNQVENATGYTFILASHNQQYKNYAIPNSFVEENKDVVVPVSYLNLEDAGEYTLYAKATSSIDGFEDSNLSSSINFIVEEQLEEVDSSSYNNTSKVLSVNVANFEKIDMFKIVYNGNLELVINFETKQLISDFDLSAFIEENVTTMQIYAMSSNQHIRRSNSSDVVVG